MKNILYLVLAAAALQQVVSCRGPKQAATQTQTADASAVQTAANPNAQTPTYTVSADVRQALQSIRVEDGLEVKLVAAEPVVNTPIAMLFDERQRLWVLEMPGYMPDTLGTGENQPNGKVVLLTDTNQDGVYDTRKVVVDSLVLPRSICLIENGLLVAEPPNLWFYELKDDKVVKRQLVDAQYAVGGNVEHQANGLYRGLDNWIYNANSAKRYRKKGDTWLIETTIARGQWGIAQDNDGRLFYNNNSQNLLGDAFLPALAGANKYQRNAAGFNEKVVADNKVYPIRPTPAVNRGYMKTVLNDSLKLLDFTAASAPLIYRGGLLGPDYDGNAFVPEPSANLIKRNILTDKGNAVAGRQAYKNREFLASTDERFRPVSLYDGPDGGLYVVDMHRGIIQHKTYLTPYLKQQIGKRNLTEPLNTGRIYKVVPKGKTPTAVRFPTSAEGLVALLANPNGWVRDKAQQLIIDRGYTSLIPALRSAVTQTSNTLQAIHAFWALEGLNALTADEVQRGLQSPEWRIRRQALGAVQSILSAQNQGILSASLQQLVERNDTLAAPYIGFLARTIRPFNAQLVPQMLLQLVKQNPNNLYVSDAVISSLQDKEADFEKALTAVLPDKKALIFQRLNRVSVIAQSASTNRDPALLKKLFPKGEALFATVCQTCHGADGNGIKALGPPLNKSEWVTGDRIRLSLIVLFGLTGPVTVNGHVYQTPEVSGEMPGIGYDKSMPNEDIAQLLSYIRKSWQNNADVITAEEVARIRDYSSTRQKAFTEAELKEIGTGN